MFGFSLSKLIVVALVIAAVWYGYRLIARRNLRRAARDAEDTPRPAVEDMTGCPACGTFVPALGARSCGRKDCPYPA